MLANEGLPEGMNGGLKMSIKFEDVVLPSAEQWKAIIMGARNPMNSWSRSDSYQEMLYVDQNGDENYAADITIGPNDLDLMKRLRNAGTDHRKFMRMIPVIVTITAPLYWWKEFDTYKVGTVANSCSTMHKIAAKEFTLEDFSTEHLYSDELEFFKEIIERLNGCRNLYLQSKKGESARIQKNDWWQMIQLLPSSYNQKRTVMMNYEVLANIYKSRKNHKLDEWAGKDCFKDLARDCNTCIKQNSIECHNGKEGGFIQWIESLPYSELITGEFKEEK